MTLIYKCVKCNLTYQKDFGDAPVHEILIALTAMNGMCEKCTSLDK